MIIDDICLAFFKSEYQSYFSNKEKTYISLLLNSWIDAILVAVPSIEKLINIRDESEFSNFILWCFDNKNLLNWTVGISMIRYLKYLEKDIDDNTKKMLILFSCSQWTYENKSNDYYLFIASNEYKELLFCSKKSDNAKIAREVYMIKNDFINFNNENDFYYFTLCKNSNITPDKITLKAV